MQFIEAGVWPRTFHNRYCSLCIHSEILAEEINIKKSRLVLKVTGSNLQTALGNKIKKKAN